MHALTMSILLPLATLGMFYFTLARCVRPELRSTQRCVQLIALVASMNVLKYWV